MLAGYCSHCAPIFICSWRPLRGPTWKVLGCTTPALFQMPSQAHWRAAAKSSPHRWLGRYPLHPHVLQHIWNPRPTLFRSYGDSWRAEVVWALTNSHYVCGSRRECAGACAFDTLVSPWQLYSNDPTQIPSTPTHQVPTRLLRCVQRVRQEGKQRIIVYELNQWLWQFGRGKPRLGGLSVNETEERRIAAMQAGARCGHATRTKRKRTTPKAAGAQWGYRDGWQPRYTWCLTRYTMDIFLYTKIS